MASTVYGDFAWDSEKASANLAKHGVSFVEAVSVLLADETIETADLIDASRVVTIGFSFAARVLLVVSTETDRERVRIISARLATPAERRVFDKR